MRRQRRLVEPPPPPFRTDAAVKRYMERRFRPVTDIPYLRDAILWRMRVYCDNNEPEKADVLAELLTDEAATRFYEWYYVVE